MFRLFLHWKVLLNLFLVIVIFSGLVWLTFRWLEYRTNYGQEILIPNVVNMSVHDAMKVLEDNDLQVEVDSFKFNPKYKSFQVLQMYPSAGSRVKGGRSVMLKINPKTWAKVSVPDILGKSKHLVFTQLDLVGLKIGNIIYQPNLLKDAVIGMQFDGSELKPGTLLPKFSVVDLVIGSGPMQNIVVPSLIGLTVREAKSVIALRAFEVGLGDYLDGGEDDSDIIYFQDPKAGALRDQGMQIDFWASKKTFAELQSKIEELNKKYRVDIPDDIEEMDRDSVIFRDNDMDLRNRESTFNRLKSAENKLENESSVSGETKEKLIKRTPQSRKIIIE